MFLIFNINIIVSYLHTSLRPFIKKTCFFNRKMYLCFNNILILRIFIRVLYGVLLYAITLFVRHARQLCIVTLGRKPVLYDHYV